MLEIIFYSFAIACLSLFIQKCYGPNMIFRRIYLLLIYYWIKNWRKKDRYKRYFIKPFMCVYCYNTWLVILFWLFFFKLSFCLFLSIGISYICLESLKKLLNI